MIIIKTGCFALNWLFVINLNGEKNFTNLQKKKQPFIIEAIRVMERGDSFNFNVANEWIDGFSGFNG